MKLIDYLRGDRRGREAHRIEFDAMTDPFLHEAFEGYETSESDPTEALERLLNAVRARTESKSHWPAFLWTVAATVLLAVVCGGIYYVSQDPDRWARRRSAQRNQPGVLATVMSDRNHPAETWRDTLAEPIPESATPGSTLQSPPQTRSGNDPTRVTGEVSPGVVSGTPPTMSGVVPSVAVPQPAAEKTPSLAAQTAQTAGNSATSSATPAATSVTASNATTAAAEKTSTADKTSVPQSATGIAPTTTAERTAAGSAQGRSVSGRVTDAKGQPLENVMIISDKNKQGVMTDRNGYFHMENLPESDKLVVALFGYESHQINVPNDASPVSIVMRESAAGKDEIVVAGYGTLKKSETTGAVSTRGSRTETAAESSSDKAPQEAGEANVPRTTGEADQALQATDATSELTLNAARKRFTRYVSSNLVHPTDESGDVVRGTVVASFRVNAKGRPNAIRIDQSLSPEADHEAQRLIRGGPDWPPGDNRVTVTIAF